MVTIGIVFIVGAVFIGKMVIAAPPYVSFSPTEVSFGQVELGSIQQTATIKVSRVAPDEVLRVLYYTSDVSPNPFTFNVPAGGWENGSVQFFYIQSYETEKEITVHFNPSVAGEYNATMTFWVDSPFDATNGYDNTVYSFSGEVVPPPNDSVCPKYYEPRGRRIQDLENVGLSFGQAFDPAGGDNLGYGPGIAGYILYIDDDKHVTSESDTIGRSFQSFNTAVDDGFATNSEIHSFVIPQEVYPIFHDTRYYWAIEVVDAAGELKLCPPGSPNTFVTAKDPLQAPIVVEGVGVEYPTETILYDARIFTNPPPGFTDERFTLPRTLEVAPN